MKVARNLNVHTETVKLSSNDIICWNLLNICLEFRKCYFKVEIFNEVLKEVWGKGFLKEKEEIKRKLNLSKRYTRNSEKVKKWKLLIYKRLSIKSRNLQVLRIGKLTVKLSKNSEMN